MGNLFEQPEILIPPPGQGESRIRSNKIRHQKLTSAELRDGKNRLAELSEKAMRTLDEAMDYAEYPTAIAAAKIALDRSGFGPSSTLHLDTTKLEEIPTEQLLSRGMELLGDSKEGKTLLEKLRLLRERQTTDNRPGPEAKSDMIH